MSVAYLIFTWFAMAITVVGIAMSVAALLWLVWVGICELLWMFRGRP